MASIRNRSSSSLLEPAQSTNANVINALGDDSAQTVTILDIPFKRPEDDHDDDCDTLSESRMTLRLRIPREFMSITNRPLRWLSYVGFTICGAMGELRAEDAITALDLDADNAPPHVVYMTSGDLEHIVDPHAGSDRTSDTANALGLLKGRRRDFHKKVTARDQDQCVFLDVPPDFPEYKVEKEVAHLLPHSKRDAYMQEVYKTRSDLYPNGPVLDCIDSAYNGISCGREMHRVGLTPLHVGLLRVPNQFMGYEDVVIDVRDAHYSDKDPFHIHLHIVHKQFIATDLFHFKNIIPQRILGADMRVMWDAMVLRLNYDSPDIPPALIWDFLYGATMLARFLDESTASVSRFNAYALERFGGGDQGHTDDEGGGEGGGDDPSSSQDQLDVDAMLLVQMFSESSRRARMKRLEQERIRSWMSMPPQ